MRVVVLRAERLIYIPEVRTMVVCSHEVSTRSIDRLMHARYMATMHKTSSREALLTSKYINTAAVTMPKGGQTFDINTGTFMIST
jgi:hypothetical protein